MKSKTLVLAGLIAVVSVYFAPGVFVIEGPIVSPDIRAKVDTTWNEAPVYHETYYPAVSPDVTPKLDKGTPFAAGPSYCPAPSVSPCK